MQMNIDQEFRAPRMGELTHREVVQGYHPNPASEVDLLHAQIVWPGGIAVVGLHLGDEVVVEHYNGTGPNGEAAFVHPHQSLGDAYDPGILISGVGVPELHAFEPELTPLTPARYGNVRLLLPLGGRSNAQHGVGIFTDRAAYLDGKNYGPMRLGLLRAYLTSGGSLDARKAHAYEIFARGEGTKLRLRDVEGAAVVVDPSCEAVLTFSEGASSEGTSVESDSFDNFAVVGTSSPWTLVQTSPSGDVKEMTMRSDYVPPGVELAPGAGPSFI